MSHLKSLEPNKLQEYEMHFAKKKLYTHTTFKMTKNKNKNI